MLQRVRSARRQFVIGAITACLALVYYFLFMFDMKAPITLNLSEGAMALLASASPAEGPWVMMWNCALADPPAPAIAATLKAERAALSQTEPLGLRTVADGNYLPRMPASFTGPNCTPVMQRGHVVVYTPKQVREMLAGGGPIEGTMPPFEPRRSTSGPTDDRNCPLKRPGPSSSIGAHTVDANVDLEIGSGSTNAEGAHTTKRYTPVVVFADLGYDDDPLRWVENVPIEWILHTVFTPRTSNAFVAAVFFHRQNVTNAFDLEAAQEYLRIPGVTRVLFSYLFPDRPDENCGNLGRLARFVQPHMMIAGADEKGARSCPSAVVAQQCYGADRARCGADKCARPVAMAEFYTHNGDGVAHVPTWTWPLAEPRPMRRADTPEPPAGWNAYDGWPLPFGRLHWKLGTAWSRAAAPGFICQLYEPKNPPPPPIGTYTNENLRPLDCYNLSLRSCLLAPAAEPLYVPDRDAELAILPACPAPPAPDVISQYYAFPPRFAFPLQAPAVERPRRLVWSLVGSTKYGGRLAAMAAFQAEFPELPSLGGGGGMDRFETLARVVCDSVFVLIGAGNAAFETARPFEAARCGAIPVVATIDPPMWRPSTVRDSASAFTTLIGYEGRWPDGWIVAPTWAHAAALARRALETPGEVLRLRRAVMGSYARMQNAMHARARLATRRAADPDHFWDANAAFRAVDEQRRVDNEDY